MRMHIEVAIMTKLTFLLQYSLLIHNDVDVAMHAIFIVVFLIFCYI